MAAKGYFDDKISDSKCEDDKYYDASDEKGGSLRSYEDGGKDCNDQIAVDILKVSYSPRYLSSYYLCSNTFVALIFVHSFIF